MKTAEEILDLKREDEVCLLGMNEQAEKIILKAMEEYAEQFKPKKKSTALERIRARTPLLTKFKVAFEMHDYKNWEDGVYKGNAGQYAKIANEVIKEHQTKTK